MPEFNDRRASIPAEQRVTKGYAAKWHGGASYSHPDESHLEHFPTKAAAKAELQNRYNSGRHNNFQTLSTDHTGAVSMGESNHLDTPAVDRSSYMDLHPIRKDGTYDSDVFHRLEVGKRGGVKGQWS